MVLRTRPPPWSHFGVAKGRREPRSVDRERSRGGHLGRAGHLQGELLRENRTSGEASGREIRGYARDKGRLPLGI